VKGILGDANAIGRIAGLNSRAFNRRKNEVNNMSSLSCHVSWKSLDTESLLHASLTKVNYKIQELPSQEWDASTSWIGGIRDYKLCMLAPNRNSWSFLLLHLNSQLADSLAQEVSNSSASPVIVFCEYDQIAWGFSIFDAGHCIAHFWNRPECVEEETSLCSVKAEQVANSFSVDAKLITPYLIRLNPNDEDQGRVFPDDQFSLGDHWVRCDFMRRLGMRYPNPGDAGTRYVYIKETGVN
jgi:hypothetical protein